MCGRLLGGAVGDGDAEDVGGGALVLVPLQEDRGHGAAGDSARARRDAGRWVVEDGADRAAERGGQGVERLQGGVAPTRLEFGERALADA